MTPRTYAFRQVDVFSAEPLRGNAVAVVFGAEGLDTERMQAFARWTQLSETTFVLPPTVPQADYRLRIFTPEEELPFAGHPTLGSCHAWLETGGTPRGAEVIQECGVGLIRLRRDGTRLAFAAPPLRRHGPADAATCAHVARGLRVPPSELLAVEWVDNGPGWVAALLADADAVRALRPDYAAMAPLNVGVVGPCAAGGPVAFEVRAFVPSLGVPEDPVTGSLNAGLAQWLIGSGRAPERYVASQGACLQRAGRVHVERLGPDIWVGGESVTCIAGHLSL